MLSVGGPRGVISRTLAISRNLFWEVLRQRVLYLIGFFALFLLSSLRLISEIAIGTEDKIITDLGISGIGVFGLIVAVFVGTEMINKEIEKRTILVLLAKPISRSELIVGKHLGLAAVLALLIAITTMIYFAILSANNIDYQLGSILVAMVYIFLELSLLTAFAIAFGVLTSGLLGSLLTFGIYLMGHLSPDIVKAGALTENPAIITLTKYLYLILPDLTKLDLKNMAVYGQLPPLPTLAFNAVYAIFYTVLVLSITTLAFRRREF
ncbi:MAG TPA: ABC transporter permease subunit [Oscillatoriaceae cyanobacterium M33_DOE_052]|uniref:ABC transporter permease n=1 Tax=Planktothricoides sp. SpSt-374 TaxID=2282167 RepID=A0A7C3VQ87_9CYAN|nr:ABC transporter permease subunit [Oscillatoriaceae cyanobacterium M33_DOE_052]